MKIQISLAYPFREDLQSYGLPLPEYVLVKEGAVLLFPDQDAFYRYAGQICRLVDELEENRFFKYNRLKMQKLQCCERLLQALAAAPLTIG
jgi:hypothetical protein